MEALWREYIEGEEPLLSFKLSDRKTGNALDLTSVSSVGIKTWFAGTTPLIIDGTADVDADPTSGLFSYQVLSGNFGRVGRHEGEITVTYSGGEIRKVFFVLGIKKGAPA